MAKYANLRDRVSFPRVLDLPNYQIYDPEHYKHVSDQVIEPRRHWCLLAEIIKINKGFPLKLMASSLYNEDPFHIVFHTHDLGGSFVTPDLKNERTVAIMYARKHISRWNSINVIVTDHYSIKTCHMDDQKKEHGKYCKVIRDRHFQAMWMLDWQRFRNFLTFPCAANEPDISMAL
ncbi:hypothetical protein IFM61606_06905 [Aspergillus udagawae]|nr:uncharacterized protein Aud_005156 [Aspergillus udagawae]GFF45420.1 hypothetical protein IFM51744_06062 [Aspergillus udagawae]GFF85697.1 hypothetical protein IFM53868_04566 [Aspergillus udagawae]GFG06304.1 hypothetical protein IFM5058_02854 [Aspergillus udagawae]GFG26899.1 hypothetical protein IFM61606_06905 [Aspergillus udagawae]GIC88756.1 hypothetical protein Aud_005156 [Aspergillus udagawae]